MKATLSEIAPLIQGEIIGDEHIVVSALSTIDHIIPGSLVFVDGETSLKIAEESDAAVILVTKGITRSKKPLIRVAHPFKDFVQLLAHFYPIPRPKPATHPTAIIASNVVLGNEVTIGPYVTIDSHSHIGDRSIIKGHVNIGQNVTIGADTTLHPHVTIYDNSQIGQRVAIHANTVIGSDGFGYKFVDGHHMKVPHYGHVIIEDDVEIGANTVIDRAPMHATIIGAGTKIDNLVQVAHSVKLGKHNILCAFTGIAGSTTSGDRVIFAANVGVADHVTIDDDVVLGARSGVPPQKHLLHGLTYFGTPARPKEKAFEHEVSVGRIPFMRKNIQALSDKVRELAERLAALEQGKSS
ncbi:MAG: UDP-3-O-(3-hydroxymyristoyl)glucosamine N-acyltransferase [Legionellales bacterium RIFCSPHIGHO2_12_FULL_42_9]|nr:MAG: UDP-3-O-(3-hydroxymyristoyl)glucosamine N-acyltransferase [Legionellales bacterium RIFCSPHIGHO2_12_FULL_42_9]